VAKLLAIFDALELAIKNPGFCGCPFIKALAEFGPERNELEVRAQIARHFSEMEGGGDAIAQASSADRCQEASPAFDVAHNRDDRRCPSDRGYGRCQQEQSCSSVAS
jgi:hypothetical protein